MRITRPLAALAAVPLVVGLSAPPASAASSYDPKPVKTGADWLAGQLTEGLVHNEQFDFDDVGLSIDVALGLQAAGKKPLVVKTVTRAVSKNLDSYVGFAPEQYAGAVAKVVVLAVRQDKNPRSFGGADLVSRLEGRVAASAPITGRIEDASEFGDFANVIGQAYAAQALSLAGSAKAGLVRDFLLQQQCPKGYFRQYFTSDKTRADQSCAGAPKAERGASTDATALTMLALQDVKGAAARAAVKRAAEWLVDRQRPDGLWSDTGGAAGTKNANSTGLAGWALGEAGYGKRAVKAAVAVRRLQVPSPNPCAQRLAEQVGAIAYDQEAFANGQDSGIKKRDGDQWRRASAQALPVLRWAPRAGGVLTVTAPRTVPAGESFAIAVSGAAGGERICLVEDGSTAEYFAKPQPTTRVRVPLSQRAGIRTFTVWVGSLHRDVTVRVTR